MKRTMALSAIKLSTVGPKERMRGFADLNWIGEQMQTDGAASLLIRQRPSKSENQATRNMPIAGGKIAAMGAVTNKAISGSGAISVHNDSTGTRLFPAG
jgi:hypothetical protein